MNGKVEFIEYLKTIINEEEMSKSAKLFWEKFRENEIEEKPLVTEKGKTILLLLREKEETELWKSKDIANELEINSRSAAGSLRKLAADGFLDIISKNPSIYTLTDLGKTVNLD